MTGRRVVVGLSLLCALAFTAFGAASASAAGGTTQFTCVAVVPPANGFKDAHCKEAAAAGTATFAHAVIGEENTPLIATNRDTAGNLIPATLSAIVGGVGFEIKCEIVTSKGTAQNKTIGGVMQVHSEDTVVTYEECTVPKPAKGECKVKGGKIVTETIKSTTFGGKEPEAMGIKFEPKTGTTFVPITIEGCKNAGLNGVKNVEGSVTATPTGTTVVFTGETSGKTLTFGGAEAKLDQTLTVKMQNPITGAEESGVALTTVP